MNNQTFISYSNDNREFVEWLVIKLKEANINFWYDQNEIKVGDSIKDKINEGIESSSCIIIVLSKNSAKSNWVKYEYTAAFLSNSSNKGIKIITLKIDDVEIPSSLNSGLLIDFSKDRKKGLERLIYEIDHIPPFSYPNLNWGSIDGRTFENLVFDLLGKEGFLPIKMPSTRDHGFDFILYNENRFGENEKILVEAKFYNDLRISVSTLRNLVGLFFVERPSKILLVTNTELTNTSKSFLSEIKVDIIVWDQQTLREKLYSYPELIEKYFSIKPFQEPQRVKLIDREFLEVQGLIHELETCPEGKLGWKQYEEICTKSLKYIFVPALGEPRIQSRRENNVDIRDAIFPNRSSEKNWRFIREDYDAKYIVFEFKNYSEDGEDIDKKVVLQINDYLKKTIGRFGIICSRKAPNHSGLEKRKDVFIEQNKLILFLSNDHIKEMILRKNKKQDPSDIIIDLIDEFNLNF